MTEAGSSTRIMAFLGSIVLRQIVINDTHDLKIFHVVRIASIDNVALAVEDVVAACSLNASKRGVHDRFVPSLVLALGLRLQPGLKIREGVASWY